MEDYEVEELALAVINLDRKENEKLELDEIDSNELSEIMYEQFGLEEGMDGFKKLVSKLIKFTPIIKTAITESKCHAFIKDNLILCKEYIDD